jgi:hypothetical protein
VWVTASGIDGGNDEGKGTRTRLAAQLTEGNDVRHRDTWIKILKEANTDF